MLQEQLSPRRAHTPRGEKSIAVYEKKIAHLENMLRQTAALHLEGLHGQDSATDEAFQNGVISQNAVLKSFALKRIMGWWLQQKQGPLLEMVRSWHGAAQVMSLQRRMDIINADAVEELRDRLTMKEMVVESMEPTLDAAQKEIERLWKELNEQEEKMQKEIEEVASMRLLHVVSLMEPQNHMIWIAGKDQKWLS